MCKNVPKVPLWSIWAIILGQLLGKYRYFAKILPDHLAIQWCHSFLTKMFLTQDILGQSRGKKWAKKAHCYWARGESSGNIMKSNNVLLLKFGRWFMCTVIFMSVEFQASVLISWAKSEQKSSKEFPYSAHQFGFIIEWRWIKTYLW